MLDTTNTANTDTTASANALVAAPVADTAATAALIKRIKTVSGGFTSTGKRATVLLLDCMDHVLMCGNWTPLALLLDTLPPKVSAICRAVIGKSLGGITLYKDAKTKATRFKLGDNFSSTEGLELFRELAGQEVTILGQAVADFIKKPKAAPKNVELEKFAKLVVQKLVTAGITEGDFEREMRRVFAELRGDVAH